MNMHTQNIIRFLTELNQNNNREWFAENKAWYENVKSEFENISKALILEIATFDEEIKNVEAKDCVFRIYRDTRFAADKTPYKTHFGVYIATAGGRKSERAGYYLHLDPAGSFVAAGVWCPQPNILKELRQSIYHNIEEFNEIRNAEDFKKHFVGFYEDGKLKKVPTGFPKDFPDAELLKLKHYMVEYKLNDDILNSTEFVKKVAEVVKAAYPMNCFLNYTVDELI